LASGGMGFGQGTGAKPKACHRENHALQGSKIGHGRFSWSTVKSFILVAKYICIVQATPFIEKLIIAVVLFAGFTYVRKRARRANPEAQVQPILLGIFVVIPALLLLEAKVLPYLRLDATLALVLKLALLGLTFYAVGRWIIKPKAAPEIDPEIKPKE
jgi:hypothetical protein